ncbi:MAG: MoxR family ATPase [Polyangia bacterium]
MPGPGAGETSPGAGETTRRAGEPTALPRAVEPTALPRSVDETLALLLRGRYVADRGLATVLFLSLKLGRPLLLEGDAGVGKTEIAKVLAQALGRRLIRLQCYEGLDVHAAVYEWSYTRQLLAIRLTEATAPRPAGADRSLAADRSSERERLARDLFSPEYLIKRPILQALEPDPLGPPVLLIDELDRADEPFEAYLLEVLADFQVTIPELGPIAAAAPPLCILTSNRTREIHDALKRRCFYHFIGYPDAPRELAIVRQRLPDVPERLSAQVVAFVQRLRRADLFKLPGVAETLDWAEALLALEREALDAEAVDATLGVLLKYQDDLAKVRGPEARKLLDEVQAAVGGVR